MKAIRRIMALLLCMCMLFSALSIHSSAAAAGTYGPYEYDNLVVKSGPVELKKSATMNGVQKAFYNALNAAGSALLRVICDLYTSPRDWKDVSEFDGSGFLPGRETYATSAAKENEWRVGYGSRSVIPTDFQPGMYYIGRNVETIKPVGVLDDNRVRAAAFDDGSGEGLVIFAVVDSLGVTRADTLSVRERILEWAKAENIPIASINLSATHSHSALDAQGVATEFFYKLFVTGWKSLLNIRKDKKLEEAEAFKAFYLNAAVEAIQDAVRDMRPGKLFYARVDTSAYAQDKRGLIAAADLPKAAVLRFDPTDGSAGLYLADVACHPTSFSADHRMLTADYIAYMEQRVEEKTGCRFLFAQGASGMVSRRDVGIQTDTLPEDERLGAETRYMGRVFADLILAADMEELPPVLNVRHTQFLHEPTNYILALAVKAQLVNDQVYTSNGGRKLHVVIEEGYVEFGGRVGLCLFPVELYPEVFYGAQTINDGDHQKLLWENSDWTYPVPVELAPREGIDLYAMHLTNDSMGYCVLDNNFAFFGHIIGDGDADEALSMGKYTASTLVTEFKKLMDSLAA